MACRQRSNMSVCGSTYGTSCFLLHVARARLYRATSLGIGVELHELPLDVICHTHRPQLVVERDRPAAALADRARERLQLREMPLVDRGRAPAAPARAGDLDAA